MYSHGITGTALEPCDVPREYMVDNTQLRNMQSCKALFGPILEQPGTEPSTLPCHVSTTTEL